jgi:hypothetical protein
LRFLNYRRSSQRRQHHPHQVRILTICFVPHFSFCTILFIAFSSAFASAFHALFVFCVYFRAPVEFKTLLIGCCSTIIILLLLVLSISSLLRFLLYRCIPCRGFFCCSRVCSVMCVLLWKLENAFFFLINLNSPCVDVLDCEETHDSWLWISLSLSLCVSLSTLSRTISHFGCTAARFCYLLIYMRRIIVSIVIDSFRGWSSWSCFRKSSFLWSLLDPPPAEDLIFSAFACFLVNLYVPTVRTRGIWLNRHGILLRYIIVLSLHREQTALVATRWTLGRNFRQWTLFPAMSCMPREERKHLYSARLQSCHTKWDYLEESNCTAQIAYRILQDLLVIQETKRWWLTKKIGISSVVVLESQLPRKGWSFSFARIYLKLQLYFLVLWRWKVLHRTTLGIVTWPISFNDYWWVCAKTATVNETPQSSHLISREILATNGSSLSCSTSMAWSWDW